MSFRGMFIHCWGGERLLIGAAITEISTKVSQKAKKRNFHNVLVNSNHRNNQETPGKRGLQVRDWQEQTHLLTALWIVLFSGRCSWVTEES